MRVLVVNAGSSSLKLALLDGGRAGRLRDRGALGGGGTPRADRDVPGGRRAASTRCGHRVVHGGPELTEPVRVDDEGARATCDSIEDLAPLHNPRALAGDAGGAGGCCRTCPRSPASTPPSTPTCRRRRGPTRCPRSGTSGGACAATASTGSATPTPCAAPRSSSARPARGPAAGLLPPGGRGVAGGRARRPLGRHHDGVHADGGPGDGHPVRLRRPRTAAVAAGARGTSGRRRCPTPSSATPGCKGLSGTSRRPARRRRVGRVGGDPDAALAFDVYVPPAAPGGRPRWRRRRAGSTCSCSPAASGSTRRRCRSRARRGSGLPRGRARRGRQPPVTDGDVSGPGARGAHRGGHRRRGRRDRPGDRARPGALTSARVRGVEPSLVHAVRRFGEVLSRHLCTPYDGPGGVEPSLVHVVRRAGRGVGGAHRP